MEHVTPFILGGLIIGLTVLISKKLGPKRGAMFYWFPSVFVASVLLMQDHKSSSTFAKEAIPAGIFLFIFTLIYFYLSNKHSERVWSNMLITIVVWFVLAFIFVKLFGSS